MKPLQCFISETLIMNLFKRWEGLCSLRLSAAARVVLLVTCGGLSAQLHATIQAQLTPSLASPQSLGTTITLTASATDSNPGPVTYKFEWQMSGNSNFHMMRDFSLGNTLKWTPNIQEGTYLIQVTARDYLAKETSQTTLTFVVTPLVLNNPPVVISTAHPLVALFSAPSCPAGSSMRVGFVLSTSTQMNYTNFRPCHPPASMNFYIAGMMASSTYDMHYEVQTGTTIVPDSNILPFTTRAIPPSAPMAITSVLIAPTSKSAVSSGILFTGYVLEPKALPVYPAATDLSGNVLWYYPGFAQITRLATDNPVAGTSILLDSNGTGTGTGPFGNNSLQQIIQEVDLAGNVLRETNADRISEQLVAMGTDPIGNFHHEVTRLRNGHTIAFGSVQRIYPAGTQGSANPVDVLGVMIIELDQNWQVFWYWNAFDHAGGGTQLDINRPATLGETCMPNVLGCPPVLLSSPANDWLHANSAQSEPDGSLLVSLRDQDWVIKIDRGTGNILWRLGLSGDFAINSTDPYPWFSGQHDVEFQYGGTQVLTVFDDGNTRITENPGEHSRCQSYNIDQANLTASLLLNKDLGVYSFGLGSMQVLPNGNYTCDAGYMSLTAPYQESIEVAPYTAVAYKFKAQAPSYRAWRMPSLYTLAAVTSVPPVTLACPVSSGTVGVGYHSGLATAGGVPPYIFSITAGSLPPGVALTNSTGAVTGTPSKLGIFNFTGQAVDSLGADTGTATCTITIS